MKSMTLLILLFTSVSAFSQTFAIEKGEATYKVKHIFKTVEGTSKDVKGKVQCKDSQCEFLIAVNVASFISSDSNRDLNMQLTTDTKKYPITMAKGTFSLEDWKKPKFTIKAEIDFHGVKKNYVISMTSKDDNNKQADVTIKLDDHNVERPSLFTSKIENEVPVHFELTWKQTN